MAFMTLSDYLYSRCGYSLNEVWIITAHLQMGLPLTQKNITDILSYPYPITIAEECFPD